VQLNFLENVLYIVFHLKGTFIQPVLKTCCNPFYGSQKLKRTICSDTIAWEYSRCPEQSRAREYTVEVVSVVHFRLFDSALLSLEVAIIALLWYHSMPTEG
jgi:hypothetical protein